MKIDMKNPMREHRFGLGLLLMAAVLLSGCDETKRALGQTKEAPDEFTVYQRAPLSLPPDFALRPPTPGTKRPQAVNPRDSAAKALGVRVRTADRSAAAAQAGQGSMSQGERSVLAITGADQADPTIRNLVNQETSSLFNDSKSFTDKIVFWQSTGGFGTAVDPAKESKRLREAQALGTPLNSDKIPVISRKKKALFEGVFK